MIASDGEDRPVRPVNVHECGDGAEVKRAEVGDMVEIEEESGKRTPVKIQDLVSPMPEGVREHTLAHLPRRSLCPHCVRGQGKTMDHKKAERTHRIPEIHMDYCFMGGRPTTRPGPSSW